MSYVEVELCLQHHDEDADACEEEGDVDAEAAALDQLLAARQPLADAHVAAWLEQVPPAPAQPILERLHTHMYALCVKMSDKMSTNDLWNERLL